MTELEFIVLHHLQCDTYRTKRAIRQYLKAWSLSRVNTVLSKLEDEGLIERIEVFTTYCNRPEVAYIKLDE